MTILVKFNFFRGRLYFLTLSALCLMLAFFIFIPGRARAQEFRGTISGTITDSSGAVVKEAQVTIIETNTGTINRTKTDSAGQYVVPFLQPGTYQLVVEMTSFKKDVRNGITLQANEHPLIDMTLQVGNAQETISVTEMFLWSIPRTPPSARSSVQRRSKTTRSTAVLRSLSSNLPLASFLPRSPLRSIPSITAAPPAGASEELPRRRAKFSWMARPIPHGRATLRITRRRASSKS
jgi:hypothetical protein